MENVEETKTGGVVVPLILTILLAGVVGWLFLDSKASSDAAVILGEAIEKPSEENIKKAKRAYDKVVLKPASIEKKKKEVDSIVTEREDKVRYEKVNELVVKAEKHEKKEYMVLARMEVETLRNEKHKEELMGRLTGIVQKQEARAIREARVSVEVAERTRRGVDYDRAKERVNQLAGSKRKQEFENRLTLVNGAS